MRGCSQKAKQTNQQKLMIHQCFLFVFKILLINFQHKYLENSHSIIHSEKINKKKNSLYKTQKFLLGGVFQEAELCQFMNQVKRLPGEHYQRGPREQKSTTRQGQYHQGQHWPSEVHFLLLRWPSLPNYHHLQQSNKIWKSVHVRQQCVDSFNGKPENMFHATIFICWLMT